MSRLSNPSTTESVPPSPEFGYQTLSRGAVVALVLGVLSWLAFLFPVLTILSAVGVIVAWLALRKIAKMPHELTGAGHAKFGLVLSMLSLVGGPAVNVYWYYSQIPPNSTPISFAALQPDKKHPELPISPEALELDGKRVFVRGYVHPGVSGQGAIRKFILVPDMGTCCFGGQPKLTDMIEVTLRDPLRIQYTMHKRRLAGTLKVDTRLKPVTGLQGVYYQLDADYVK